MRLLKLRSFFEWPSLVVYEDVIPNDFVEIPYHEVSDEIWSQTAILSWRWHQSKPWTHADLLAKPGFSPMSQEQFIELRAMLKAVQESLSYVWIDWCCVGQYLTDSMIEVSERIYPQM